MSTESVYRVQGFIDGAEIWCYDMDARQSAELLWNLYISHKAPDSGYEIIKHMVGIGFMARHNESGIFRVYRRKKVTQPETRKVPKKQGFRKPNHVRL